MHAALQTVCVVAALAAVGKMRMSFEQELTQSMKQARILTPSFDMQSRAGLSQKGFVASFGSLRPTLAAVAALGSAKHHARSDWPELERSFETVVLLDPYNPYYWDLGAWHMAYNASTSSRDDSVLPPISRERLYQQWTQKGSAFYERGIAANPHVLSLRLSKARLWSSPYRIPDYPLVASTLEQALAELSLTPSESRKVRTDLFYTLLRIPERANDAYTLGRELFDADPELRYPSLVNGLAALQMLPDVTVDSPLTLVELYRSPARAHQYLTNYLNEKSSEKPRFGVKLLLEKLEQSGLTTFPE